MWHEIKPRLKCWKFWVRVLAMPVMWAFVCMEYIGERGYYYLDKLPRPPR